MRIRIYIITMIILLMLLPLCGSAAAQGYPEHANPHTDNPGAMQAVGMAPENFEGAARFIINSSGIITDYKGSDTDLIIPDTVDGIKVTGIGFSAFSECSNLKSILIPDGVTDIEWYAFSECSNLESITIPDSVTSIGFSAFFDCSSLKSVYAESLEGWLGISFSSSDSNPMFYADTLYFGGEPAVSLSIPDSITTIGASAFYGCSGLESVIIPDGVTDISYYAFEGCTGLKHITIPDSVSTIGYYAFEGCTGLESVYAESLEGWLGISFGSSTGNPMFYADNLYFGGEPAVRLAIPDGVTDIGNYAFTGCTSLENILLPDSVSAIGYYAFEGCSSLTSVTIPDGVACIGASAFYDCISLADVIIPGSVTCIDASAFQGCSSLTSVTISDGVACIGNSAFRDCSSLASVTLPDSVTDIGACAFYHCTSLAGITLPDSATAINFSAFEGCSRLARVGIPDSITTIGDYSFSGCSSLASVSIPDSVIGIGNEAFSGCGSLTKVYLLGSKVPCADFSAHFSPNNVSICCREFSDIAFWARENGYRCQYADLGTPEFLTLSPLTGAQLYPGETIKLCVSTFPLSPSEYEIAWQSSAPDVVSAEDGLITALSAGTAAITASCGSQSGSITVSVPDIIILTLPASLSAIREEAFTGLNIEMVVLLDGLTEIGPRAFADCAELLFISMPDSVEFIADDAFEGCSGVTFRCASENAAAAYAADHGIPCVIGR